MESCSVPGTRETEILGSGPETKQVVPGRDSASAPHPREQGHHQPFLRSWGHPGLRPSQEAQRGWSLGEGASLAFPPRAPGHPLTWPLSLHAGPRGPEDPAHGSTHPAEVRSCRATARLQPGPGRPDSRGRR